MLEFRESCGRCRKDHDLLPIPCSRKPCRPILMESPELRMQRHDAWYPPALPDHADRFIEKYFARLYSLEKRDEIMRYVAGMRRVA